MIRGKRIFPPPTSKGYPYEIGDWVMVQGVGDTFVGCVKEANYMVCTIRFVKHAVWVEVETNKTRREIESVEQQIPVASILYKMDEDVAKNLLLLKGIEL